MKKSILNRPMFKQVKSPAYGTGIASNLVSSEERQRYNYGGRVRAFKGVYTTPMTGTQQELDENFRNWYKTYQRPHEYIKDFHINPAEGTGPAGEGGGTNTGGGGGSSFDGVTGAAGGSGVVIVKELNKASGVWNLKTQFQKRKENTWPS